MQRINPAELKLPAVLTEWIGKSPVFESSGWSGAQTVFIDRGEGAYLKISAAGSLKKSAALQTFWAEAGLSSPVIRYLSEDRDYLLTAPVRGVNGVSPEALSDPVRLSEIFGASLRRIHQTDFSRCPVQDELSELLADAKRISFNQEHLDLLRPFIGPARAEDTAREIEEGAHLLKRDVLMHGDYCLPNIILRGGELSGFIDVGESGVGDRHYDLAWGLWTLRFNLKSPEYGERFLDAYGRENIDPVRLRICGLLSGLN